jgi:hypothetical protein
MKRIDVVLVNGHKAHVLVPHGKGRKHFENMVKRDLVIELHRDGGYASFWTMGSRIAEWTEAR